MISRIEGVADLAERGFGFAVNFRRSYNHPTLHVQLGSIGGWGRPLETSPV
jgi:hypothetical protein